MLTNRMTIVAWKLFRTSKMKHLGFILYRLRRDFGFTDWEIANLTGIPMTNVSNYLASIKPVLDLEVLDILARMDEKGEIEAWKNIPDNSNFPQGYVMGKEQPAWYEEDKASYGRKRLHKEPYFKLGSETEE